ncbi:ATP-binding protein [Gemmobacter serpentinus]|uniref:ATP-binding protein n=1 Tax=Gemmobacter serpentinus TaxID=2652247 RepID=UPI00124EAFB6|nr:ATP-binding protein [Gemmobacter serpentinus]
MADLTILVESDPLAVRHALVCLQEAALMQGFAPDQRGRIEIVLAEALNNIVEHAYAGTTGQIRLELSLRPEGLLCQLRDSGCPLPDLQLPPGQLAAFDDCDLPEGGFGWFLIRTLTADLCYRRDEGQNELCFLVPGNPPD